jgi:hypothetical protein
LLCKISNVPDGVLVRDGSSVQCPVVATGSPAIFFLRDKMEGRSLRTIGTLSSAVLEHILKL